MPSRKKSSTQSPGHHKSKRIIIRCGWVSADPLYIKYHDREWGVPVRDDRTLFEFLVLESAQAGLSWITVLRKRENYRKAFADFDAEKVARFTPARVEKLMQNPGIIRNRAKIEAAISNARVFLNIQEKWGTFSDFIWKYVNDQPIQNKRKSLQQLPPSTPLSDIMAKDFKTLGFKFLGSTVLYAHMQATGMVNDHIVTCFRHAECQRLTQKRRVS